MNRTQEQALTHVQFAHVQAHDAAAFLERADRAWPEDLGAEIDRARALLVDAIAALDEAAPYASALYNGAP